jgi:ATP-dependent Zn protease
MRPPSAKTIHRTIAYHEAGHAVAARILGIDGRELPASGKIELELGGDDLAYVNALVDRISKETQALVSENWSAVERVAQALEVYDFLDQSELDALIWNRPKLAISYFA